MEYRFPNRGSSSRFVESIYMRYLLQYNYPGFKHFDATKYYIFETLISKIGNGHKEKELICKTILLCIERTQ